MPDTRPLGFEYFVEHHAPDLSRIARASKGEWQADDVRSEAWPLAFDLGQKLDRPLDLASPDDALYLIRCLYNHCVKYSETVVRYATRLDHAAGGDDEGGQHWLMNRLVADEGQHPLSLLETLESAGPARETPDAYHSVAAAWLQLLLRFDHRMSDIAHYLLISASWCYTCCRRAHHLAATQWPLPHGLFVGTDEDALRPWRPFKLGPAVPANDPRQMSFDYWARPPQPGHGQLWLL